MRKQYFAENPGRLISVIILSALLSIPAFSANLSFEPFNPVLPDGTTLNLFVSGDEFFNWVHDSQGFPVKTGPDGYYYYVTQNDSVFTLTSYRVGITNPLLLTALKKTVIPSNIGRKRDEFYVKTEMEDRKNKFSNDAKWSGTYNNMVIYIKFSDQSEFPSTSRVAYDLMLNSETTASVRHYYREISYNNVDMVSYHMPGGVTSTISYTDINPRDYYRPYNASTNPTGYSTSEEKTKREHGLLVRAVDFIDDNYAKPAGVNFDTNNDGNFDNVAFIIKGVSDGWNDLLWPHRWSLYSYTVALWNKRVYGYTLQLENVSMKTFSHEMFHALGAPDLYHYESTGTPVGTWDLMASGSGHPGAWMKSKYGGWIGTIPEITQSGTYSVMPLIEPSKNAYKILSPLSSEEFFVVEFRKKTGLYESKLPSSGLIITRIDTRKRGNAQGPPDEVYVFRPNGTLQSDGTINSATFSDTYSRTEFNDFTNPVSFLQDGTNAGIYISNITWHNDSMTFSVDLDRPMSFSVGETGFNMIELNWASVGSKPFMIASSMTDETFVPLPSKTYAVGDTIGKSGKIVYKNYTKSFRHSGLESDELYHYTIWSVLDESAGKYSGPLTGSGRTGVFIISSLPHFEDFSTIQPGSLPLGWKAEGGESQWNIQNSADMSLPYSILIKNLGTGSALLYTPGFYLSSSKKYLISFKYKSAPGPVKESLILNAGKNRYDGSLGYNTLLSNLAVPQTDYLLSRIIFSPPSTSDWYFSINSGIGGQGVIIDDFMVEEVSNQTKNLSDPVSFYPNPASSYIIIPARQKTNVTIYNIQGKTVLSKTIEGTRDIDVSGFAPGEYYIRFTNPVTDKTKKLIILGVR